MKSAMNLADLSLLLCKHVRRDSSASVLVFAHQNGTARMQELWVLFIVV